MGATQIMVIRHGEKPDSYGGTQYYGVDPTGQVCGAAAGEHLVTFGWQRAGGLVTLFAPPHGGQAPLGTPATLFATDPGTPNDTSSSDPSQRPYETILPLAAALGTPGTPMAIDTSYEKKDIKEVVAAALACSGVVLICWQHEDIPLVGKDKPKGISQQILDQTDTPADQFWIPSTWPTDAQGNARYDLVFVFDRPSGTGAVTGFSLVGQYLLAGDAAPPQPPAGWAPGDG